MAKQNEMQLQCEKFLEGIPKGPSPEMDAIIKKISMMAFQTGWLSAVNVLGETIKMEEGIPSPFILPEEKKP